jgi:hypothetical protein
MIKLSFRNGSPLTHVQSSFTITYYRNIRNTILNRGAELARGKG